MKKLNISVLGCGWLGLPLLKSLVADGHQVKGSSRALETLAAIKTAGGAPFAIDLPQALPTDFMTGCDVLIFTLPPRGRVLGAAAQGRYLECLAALAPWLVGAGGPAVIFTSSISIYGGARCGTTTERNQPSPDTHSSVAVLSAEEWLASTGCPLTILRLGGLVSNDRHPGRFFGGKDRPIPQADAPVNLVHRDDVISAVKLCLENNEQLPAIYNVCAAAHPTKGDFYSSAAKSLGLEVAGTTPGGANGKLIDSSRLRARGWQPCWDDLDLEGLTA